MKRDDCLLSAFGFVAGECIGIDRTVLSESLLPTCCGLLAVVTATKASSSSRQKFLIASIKEEICREVDLEEAFAAVTQRHEKTSWGK